MNTSWLCTSSFFCVPPCTFTALPSGSSCSPSMPPKAPNETARAIVLQAIATSRIKALKSPRASGKRRRSSIRNCVRVARLDRGILLLLHAQQPLTCPVGGMPQGEVGQPGLAQVRQHVQRTAEIMVLCVLGGGDDSGQACQCGSLQPVA